MVTSRQFARGMVRTMRAMDRAAKQAERQRIARQSALHRAALLDASAQAAAEYNRKLDNDNGAQWLQFLILAATMCGVDTVVMSGYAMLATHLRRWLHDARAMKAQNRFFGGIFVGAGVLLASSGKN